MLSFIILMKRGGRWCRLWVRLNVVGHCFVLGMSEAYRGSRVTANSTTPPVMTSTSRIARISDSPKAASISEFLKCATSFADHLGDSSQRLARGTVKDVVRRPITK